MSIVFLAILFIFVFLVVVFLAYEIMQAIVRNVYGKEKKKRRYR